MVRAVIAIVHTLVPVLVLVIFPLWRDNMTKKKKSLLEPVYSSGWVHDHYGRGHGSRQGTAAAAKSSHLNLKAYGRVGVSMSELTGNGKDFWNLKDQSLVPWDLPPPTKLYILIVSKQFYQLRTKYPNIWAFGDHSHSNHHEQQQTLEVPSTDYSSREMHIKAPLIWLMVDNRMCAGKSLRKNYFQSECLYLKISYKHESKMFFNMPNIYRPPTTLHQGRKVRFRLPNFPCVREHTLLLNSLHSLQLTSLQCTPMPTPCQLSP